MASNALARGQACLTCRKKKQKCDAAKPICTSCVKGNKECVYEPPRRPLAHLSGEGSSPSNRGSSHGTPSPPHVPHFNPYFEPLSNQTPPSNGHPSSQTDLIQTFLRNKEKCCFEINEERFIASLALPPSDTRRPHPCLVNAVLLLGSYFSRFSQSPSQPEDEERFLCETREELTRSYEETDRLHDFVRASNLVAFYYFYKGLHLEAYQQLTQSISVSTSCGLHQIQSPVWRPASRGEERYFLPHPRDPVEHGERILTFWQTFCFDKIMSLALLNSAPRLVDGPHYRIVTPWPRLLKEYEHANVSESDIATVSHLYDGGYAQLQYMRLETLDALQAQGLALVSQALVLNGVSTSDQSVQLLDAAVQNFIPKVPGIHSSGNMGEFVGQPIYSPVNPRLVYINTLPHLASLYIHQYGADEISRHRTLIATQNITTIVSELVEDDFESLFIGVGYLWINACEILIRILSAVRDSRSGRPELITNQYYILMNGLRRLSRVYFVLGSHVHQLESIA